MHHAEVNVKKWHVVTSDLATVRMGHRRKSCFYQQRKLFALGKYEKQIGLMHYFCNNAMMTTKNEVKFCGGVATLLSSTPLIFGGPKIAMKRI